MAPLILNRRCTNSRCSEYYKVTGPDRSNGPMSERWIGYGMCYDCSQTDEPGTTHVLEKQGSHTTSTEVRKKKSPSVTVRAMKHDSATTSLLDERRETSLLQPHSTETQESVLVQAVLLVRLYGEYAATTCIRVLAVVLSLGASTVMYYYIGATDHTTHHSRPSHLSFVIACLIYAATAIPYAYSQRRNRYQPHFYMASLGGLAGTGLCYGWVSALKILPADIVITLVLSSAFHAVYRDTKPIPRPMVEEKNGKLYRSLLPK